MSIYWFSSSIVVLYLQKGFATFHTAVKPFSSVNSQVVSEMGVWLTDLPYSLPYK